MEYTSQNDNRFQLKIKEVKFEIISRILIYTF